MSPQQLTALNLDKTAMLQQLLEKHYSGNGDELLGELQYSFLAFLMGQSLEGDPLQAAALVGVLVRAVVAAIVAVETALDIHMACQNSVGGVEVLHGVGDLVLHEALHGVDGELRGVHGELSEVIIS